MAKIFEKAIESVAKSGKTVAGFIGNGFVTSDAGMQFVAIPVGEASHVVTKNDRFDLVIQRGRIEGKNPRSVGFLVPSSFKDTDIKATSKVVVAVSTYIDKEGNERISATLQDVI